MRILPFVALLALACKKDKNEDDTSGIGGETDDTAAADDADGDGYLAGEDCDDGDASIHPDADEICNGVDNDCDGAVDEGVMPTWYEDADGDGYGDESAALEACGQPEGYVAQAGDCDDTDDEVYPTAAERCDGVDNDCDGSIDEDVQDTWYADVDGDGYGDPAAAVEDCDPDDGYVANADDCDDTAAAVNPAAEEVCDGIDNDCDGTVDDDATDAPTWYADGDGDGYGDAATAVVACEQPSGTVADGSDCDDADAAVNPEAVEICNEVDDDCDGAVDEDAADASTWYTDADADGFGDPDAPVSACEQPSGTVADATDCDDGDAATNPEAEERCDGLDNDCDGDTDEDDAADATTWYADEDGDGYGDPAASTTACYQPSGTVSDATDCDDGSDQVFPGAEEVCDGLDNDCDGTADDGATDAPTWYADADGDGYGDASAGVTACEQPSGYTGDATDCDDAEAAVNPGEVEVCDGLDNDCDGSTDGTDATDATWWYGDADGDGYGDGSDRQRACEQPSGYVSNWRDCDDTDAAINRGATEVCDGVDNDCDGAVDDDDSSLDSSTGSTWYADGDGDGYGDAASTVQACDEPAGYTDDATDCDDGDGAVNPGASEVCDGADNDCDGAVDDNDASLDTSTQETWYGDGDGDGYGDAADTLDACEQPSGYSADDTDCDDGDPEVHPGATERCNWADDDCDGADDDGLADDDGSGVADCKEVAIVVSVGFQTSGVRGICEGKTLLARELQQVDDYLDDMGLTGQYFYDDTSTGISYEELSYYPVVIHHNGGWSAVGSETTMETLQDVATAGQGLMFLGDDVMKLAYNTESAYGTSALFDLSYTTDYLSNGAGTVTVSPVTTAHAVMDGDYGTVGDFDFYADIDQGSEAGAGETVLMEQDGGYPAVLAAEDGDQRTVTAIIDTHNSHDCPISDTGGIAEIEVLFKNGVWWLGGW